MTDLKQNTKNLPIAVTQDLAKQKHSIYTGLNLLSESEISSLKKFLKDTVQEITSKTGVPAVDI